MKTLTLICCGVLLAACAPPSGQKSNHQNLNVKECKQIADAVFDAGKLSNNLCPGYMPSGEPIELP
ncbi:MULTISPECIES: hypothetical protein [Rhodobacterales]|uniref:hypothetical protein n=1 Tax=Roseobacter sp. N2S TaxID=2663844 RepID=UPI002865C25A|nr:MULTISPECIES: hypothetical protein [Rhodobacterales]MDR6266187.1 hypothetical protein [Roseobacter sp. N2S]